MTNKPYVWYKIRWIQYKINTFGADHQHVDIIGVYPSFDHKYYSTSKDQAILVIRCLFDI